MNKREKILVSLTVVVALGAGIFLYIDSPTEERQTQTQSSSQTSSQAQEAMDMLSKQDPEKKDVDASEYQLQEYERRVIQAASTPWPTNLFWQEAPETQPEIPKASLHYSGYMKTNGDYLAIINGLPFAQGERLHGTKWEKYRLQSISPTSVVLNTPRGQQKVVALQTDGPRINIPDAAAANTRQGIPKSGN